MLAAAPATAVQLTHACLAAGYHAVIPPSWGDELVAARVIQKLDHAAGPLVQCSCPRVADRFAAHVDVVAPLLVCTVAPPVAAAQYLRALYAPRRPQITFAGSCPAARHESIDAQLAPQDLLALLSSSGIALLAQPTEFVSLPADRRRFFSEPGGMPCRGALRQLKAAFQAVELHSPDIVEPLGELLLSDDPTLVDVAVALGCLCAGAVPEVNPVGARARVREHEPPRAPSAVMDHAVPVALDSDIARLASPVTAPALEIAPAAAQPVSRASLTLPVADTPLLRRRSPPGLARPVLGTAPRNSARGRPLPRAYVARRRSSPRGVRSVEPPGAAPASRTRNRALWIGGGILIGLALAWIARLL